MTIPSGPLREPLNSLKKHKNVFINGNLENIENLKKKYLKLILILIFILANTNQ